jgi:hypothetical protein
MQPETMEAFIPGSGHYTMSYRQGIKFESLDQDISTVRVAGIT